MVELAKRSAMVPTKKAANKAPAKKAPVKKAAAKKAPAKKAPAKKAAAKKAPAKKAAKKAATKVSSRPRARAKTRTTTEPGPTMALPAPPTDPLAILGLAEPPSAAQLRRAWRQFAARHHPDQGGDAVTFTRGRAAYELLLRSGGRLGDA